MAKPPERYRDAESTEEHLQVQRAQRRREPAPRFETEAYRRYRADALRAAGLDDEADASEDAGDGEMTTEQHLERVRRRR